MRPFQFQPRHLRFKSQVPPQLLRLLGNAMASAYLLGAGAGSVRNPTPTPIHHTYIYVHTYTESTRHSTPEYHRILRRGFMGGVHTLTLSGKWSKANLYVVLALLFHVCLLASRRRHPHTRIYKYMTTKQNNSKELKRMLLLAVELDPRVLRLDGFNCSEARMCAMVVVRLDSPGSHSTQRAHTNNSKAASSSRARSCRRCRRASRSGTS